MRKLLSLLAALSLSGAALAQTLVNPNVQQVQLLAPQLLAFAGSDANFQSLVNGLTQGFGFVPLRSTPTYSHSVSEYRFTSCLLCRSLAVVHDCRQWCSSIAPPKW